MEQFFSFMKIVVITGGILIGLFMILLSLPKSKLRGVFLQIFGSIFCTIAGLSVLYIINPIDILPDILPLIGQIDDATAAISAIFNGVAGIIAITQGRKIYKELQGSDKLPELEG